VTFSPRRTLRSNLNSPAFWVIALALLVASAANIAANRGFLSETSSWAEESTQAAATSVSVREGSVLPDLMGTFRIAGDRVQFVEHEGNRTFRCLENLMLQRVHQVIGDEPNETAWIVNGRVTEYRGENFLLVEMIRRTK
jgi:hypothetical protein